jgi:hypothetical protein
VTFTSCTSDVGFTDGTTLAPPQRIVGIAAVRAR